MNNLPAWLVKQQKQQQQQQQQQLEEQEKKSNNEDAKPPVLQEQFEDAASSTTATIMTNKTSNNSTSSIIPRHSWKSGHTVILSNMVGPGEVDEDLALEIQDECEVTCGRVSCPVEIQDSQSQVVQAFVTFVNAADAEKAAKLFQGRMFGNRQISARLFL